MRHARVTNGDSKINGEINFRIFHSTVYVAYINVEDLWLELGLELGIGLGLVLLKKLKSSDLASLMKRRITFERLVG